MGTETGQKERNMKYSNPWAPIFGITVVVGVIRSDEHTLEAEEAKNSVGINCKEVKLRWDQL